MEIATRDISGAGKVKNIQQKRYCLLCVVLSLFLITTLVLVGNSFGATGFPQDDPYKVVKDAINEIIGVLQNPAYKGECNKEKRRAKLRELVYQIFDFQETSKWVLGRHRRQFTPKQFKEFSDLFAKLLEKTYIKKVESYSGQKIIFGREIKFSRNKVEIRTKVLYNGQEVPIYYRLIRKHGKWVGYDVVIDGVSLVKNYRSQFNELLRKKSPEKVLEEMRNKINQPEKGDGSSAAGA